MHNLKDYWLDICGITSFECSCFYLSVLTYYCFINHILLNKVYFFLPLEIYPGQSLHLSPFSRLVLPSTSLILSKLQRLSFNSRHTFVPNPSPKASCYTSPL